jgi:hypothetical protein
VLAQNLELLEAISQDEETCAVCLRIARLSGRGQLTPFLREVERDTDLDDETKALVAELAAETPFLRALESYVTSRTQD